MSQMLDMSKYPILASLSEYNALKAFDIAKKQALAAELRAYMLEIVSSNGGHLASSLGVVELTVALHSVFDFPGDKLVWDVGHQCYAHKLLTGRAEVFSTLRQKDGLSGFPKINESEYDAFNTGHASTSVSAALGMAAARDLKGSDEEIIAVIGDGALTGGLAFEGLNNAGDIKSKLIVVLNDNNKSIADNVGALSQHLARIRTAPGYGKTKKGVKRILAKLPLFGNPLIAFIDKTKRMLKTMLLSDYFFEELGFVYLGPFDGHDIKGLCEALENAKQYSGPVLVHVITEKGRGYVPAQQHPDQFHGVAPFDIEDGQSKKQPCRTYTNAFSDALLELASENNDIVAITAAMPDGTGLAAFAEKFPERFFDVGIAEEHAVTFAAGLAAAGKKPVCAIYSSFLQRAYDQIMHDVAIPALPVVFAIDRAGIVGEDGETHQGIFDLAFLRTIPNLVIMAPKDEAELQLMLRSGMSYNLPVAVRYPKGAAQCIKADNLQEIKLNSWEILREGNAFSIIACGSMVAEALKAAEALAEKGISVQIVNARFINAVDEEILASAVDCGKLLIIEEGIANGGLGSLIKEALVNEQIMIQHIALPCEFIPQGSRKELLDEYGLSAEGIISAAEKAGWLL